MKSKSITELPFMGAKVKKRTEFSSPKNNRGSVVLLLDLLFVAFGIAILVSALLSNKDILAAILRG